ncbi:MAG: amidohydrolase [Planctomycetota bacterium]
MLLPILSILAALNIGLTPQDRLEEAVAAADRWIDGLAAEIDTLSLAVWKDAELSLEEVESSKRIASWLEQHGFTVEPGIAGMPTAFRATWQNGSGPTIGLLVEYDALPGLSQVAGPKKQARPDETSGHGCGHNLLGVGAATAAIAARHAMEASGIPGRIEVFGCPAEERGIGKVLMARAGLFDKLDAALHWHPGDRNVVSDQSWLALNNVKFRFSGRSAHAAANPDAGRSALDGVEIMNVAVNFLREHIIDEARIHYVTTNGGQAPNVVPDVAEVWYFIRAPRRDQVQAIYQRVVDCANAGALASGTEVTVHLQSALHDILPNTVLGDVLYRHLERVGAPDYDEAAEKLAADIAPTLPEAKERQLAHQVARILDAPVFPASTDVGDVSYCVPTAGLQTATWTPGTPYHSWQAVAQSGSTHGLLAMHTAAKTLAGCTLELMVRPDMLETAREELAQRTGGEPYRCGLPESIGLEDITEDD